MRAPATPPLPALPALLLGAALLAGACASAPPTSFFVLSSALTGDRILQDDAGQSRPERSVLVEAAALPDLVDRPQMVVHADAQRVVILDQQRWAEPLRSGVARVVADSLGRQLGNPAISSRDQVLRRPDCRVRLDVRRLEARPGQAVNMEALWTVDCQDQARRSGWWSAREPVASADQGALVAAHGRALDRLSADIAPALR